MNQRTPPPVRAARRGFTLMELMIVIVILGVLSTVVLLNFAGQADKARIGATQQTMNTVVQALELYRVQHNIYPPRDVGLHALVSERLLKEYPKDAWGIEIAYFSPTPNHPYEIWSAGKDREFNTADDIGQWPTPEDGG